jgi:hypothetical protein
MCLLAYAFLQNSMAVASHEYRMALDGLFSVPGFKSGPLHSQDVLELGVVRPRQPEIEFKKGFPLALCPRSSGDRAAVS